MAYVPIMGGSVPSNADVARIAHVPSQVNQLRFVVETLQKHVSILHDRLDKVVRPIGPPIQKISGNEPHEVLVPLAGEIECEVSKIEAMNSSLSSLLERLEL